MSQKKRIILYVNAVSLHLTWRAAAACCQTANAAAITPTIASAPLLFLSSASKPRERARTATQKR
jgi:hypothetical protein